MAKSDRASAKSQKVTETIHRIYHGPSSAEFDQDLSHSSPLRKSEPSLDSTTFAISGQTLLLLLIILLGGTLRFFTIGSKTIWLDEAFSIWMAHHSLWEEWSWLIKIDQHPPLYYALLHFWQLLFGDLQGVVRSFSALCGTMAIPFIYTIAHRFCDGRTGLLAALILAVSPFHIRFGQETRMYALLTLTVAVTLYFVARILMDEQNESAESHRRQRWLWVGLGVSQAAVMLTHNTATVFFPFALNLGVIGAIIAKRWQSEPSSLPTLNQPRFVQNWLLGQALALILWLPWAYPFVIQAVGVDREFWLWPPDRHMIWNTFHNFNFAFIPGWFPGIPQWNVLYWIVGLLGILWLRRTPARVLLLLSLFLAPIIGELLVSLRRPIFYDRTLIWTTLPYYIVLGAGINSLGYIRTGRLPFLRNFSRERVRPLLGAVQIALVAIILVLSAFSLNSYYFWFQKEDWAKAADYVVAHSEPGDMILFNATWVQIPFEYYLRHHDMDLTLKGLPVDLFDRGILEPKMTEADLPYMRQLIANQPHVWLVYSHDWYTDPTQIIPNELNRQMNQVDWQEFVGLKVMKFDP